MNQRLVWILGFGLLMTAVALVGGLFVFVAEDRLRRWIPGMLSAAAGSLMGGAVFFMLPHALAATEDVDGALGWMVVGFSAFFALDLVLERRHARQSSDRDIMPLGPLLLIADGLHNLLGGLAIGAIFVQDLSAGIAAWSAAALHELPQEVGDFAAIVHAGFPRRRALLYNFLSALTFPLGGLLAWGLGRAVEVGFLIALGAGNFIYIAAADLIPEVKRVRRKREVAGRLGLFLAGLGALYLARSITPAIH